MVGGIAMTLGKRAGIKLQSWLIQSEWHSDGKLTFANTELRDIMFGLFLLYDHKGFDVNVPSKGKERVKQYVSLKDLS